MKNQFTVRDVLMALDHITGGRCVTSPEDIISGKNKFVVIKSSNIPGKACMELPGLVCGDFTAPVKKIAVAMTLTECNIELAGATGVDAIVAHHPIMEAANSGGVTIREYLNLYGLSVFELHEAFHGLHPGIPFIHGHEAFRVDIAYDGIPGNIIFVGRTLAGVSTLGDILDRLNNFMGMDEEQKMLTAERHCRGCNDIQETNIATGGQILLGERTTEVHTVIHIFPHTGFSAQHLVKIKNEYPEADTIIASISRVRPDSELVLKARELQMNFIVGNSHAMEILENGLPLAKALQTLLPGVEVVLFRERITSTPLSKVGSSAIQHYAEDIAERFLVPQK